MAGITQFNFRSASKASCSRNGSRPTDGIAPNSIDQREEDLRELRHRSVARVATPGNLIAAKAALYLAMRQENVRPAELARRMNVDQPSINRLLDPRHASRPAQFDTAFAKLGKRLVLSLENAV